MRCQKAMADTFLLAFPAVVFHLVTCCTKEFSVFILSFLNQSPVFIELVLICLHASAFFFFPRSDTACGSAMTPVSINGV